MEKKFSTHWIKSKQTRKQRKYRFNAPLHIKQKFCSSNIAKSLGTKKRTAQLKVGDKVKIMRGQFKGKSGKVEEISLKTQKTHISGIDHYRKDGNKSLYPIHISNLQIIELELKDKKRKRKLENDKKSS